MQRSRDFPPGDAALGVEVAACVAGVINLATGITVFTVGVTAIIRTGLVISHRLEPVLSLVLQSSTGVIIGGEG